MNYLFFITYFILIFCILLYLLVISLNYSLNLLHGGITHKIHIKILCIFQHQTHKTKHEKLAKLYTYTNRIPNFKKSKAQKYNKKEIPDKREKKAQDLRLKTDPQNKHQSTAPYYGKEKLKLSYQIAFIEPVSLRP